MYIENGLLKDVNEKDLESGKLTLPGETLYLDDKSIPEELRSKIKKIIFNNNLQSISSEALAYTSIKEAILPKNLSKIEYGSFQWCKELERVVLPDNENFITLDQYVFAYCKKLKEVENIENITRIEGDTFYKDKELKIKINERVARMFLFPFGLESENVTVLLDEVNKDVQNLLLTNEVNIEFVNEQAKEKYLEFRKVNYSRSQNLLMDTKEILKSQVLEADEYIKENEENEQKIIAKLASDKTIKNTIVKKSVEKDYNCNVQNMYGD